MVRPVGLARRVLEATFTVGLALGLRDVLQPVPESDSPIVVIDETSEPPPPGPVTLYFHPEVPEASLVLVR
ncbi:MAG: hypothetical protein M3011_02195 [Actinomycetota bacterium]|nr:hypothetical protein [Actinomycetota bacterium]